MGKRLFLAMIFFLSIGIVSIAGAGDFSGNYTLKTAQNTITLSLSQNKNGVVSGLLFSTTGAKFKITGKVEDDVIIGECRTGNQAIPFEAHFETHALLFSLTSQGKTIKFPLPKDKHLSADNRQKTPGANGSKKNNQRLTGKTGSGKSLLGSWICQTANGTLSLNFLSPNRLTFNGDPAGYTASPDKLTVQADGQTMVYPYSFNKRGLMITFPNGVKAQFVRGRGQAAATGGALFSQLVGRWKDIRSSGNTIIELAPNGQYSYYSDYAAGNSASGQTNWGYANSNKDRGTWTARGTPRAGTIFYRSQNGSADTLAYHVHVKNGKTYWGEYYFGGTIYVKQ